MEKIEISVPAAIYKELAELAATTGYQDVGVLIAVLLIQLHTNGDLAELIRQAKTEPIIPAAIEPDTNSSA